MEKLNQVTVTNKIQISVEKPICKINISGYSLDNYKTLNPESHTILGNLI